MKGITIKLLQKTKTGEDPFGEPVFSSNYVDVDDVLVGEPTTDDIQNTSTLYGKVASYRLAIPKGDTNVWEDTEVILPAPFEGTYQTIGYPTAGIEANIPLRWNKKVFIERING